MTYNRYQKVIIYVEILKELSSLKVPLILSFKNQFYSIIKAHADCGN